MSNDIHPAAAAAREIHRSETGQFGHQGRTTPADLAEVYDEDTVYDALMNDVVVLMGVDRDEFRAELGPRPPSTSTTNSSTTSPDGTERPDRSGPPTGTTTT